VATKAEQVDLDDVSVRNQNGQLIRVNGITPLMFDPYGQIPDYIDHTTGVRRIVDFVPSGYMPQNINGMMPAVFDDMGDALFAYDGLSANLVADRPLVSRQTRQNTQGVRASDIQEGRTVGGMIGGEIAHLVPLYAPQRLALMADSNGIQQLFLLAENENLGTEWSRQITYAQADVTGFTWVKFPTADDPGIVQITRADQPWIKRRRHFLGRAHVHSGPAATAEPDSMVAIIHLSQSGGVGAGSAGGSAPGAQTVYDLMTRYGETFPARLLRFNGGVLPHQVGAGSDEAEIAIDPAQLASFQALREGDNDNDLDRETTASALALHLNGPNGYDGSEYILTGSFGFGSTSFTDLILDGATVKTAYQNALTAIQAAQDLCDAASIDLEVIVVYDQGEADANTPATTYRDYLTTWHTDLETRVGAITGQSTVKLFLSQTLWSRGSQPTACYSAFGQALAADAVADIHLLPPSYFTDPEGDPIHHKATEHQWRGALYGEAIADVVMGRADPALRLSAATYPALGDEITVSFNYSVTQDRDTIIDLGDEQGLSHDNSAGTTQDIKYALKSGPDSYVITLDDAIPEAAAETVMVAADYATDTAGFGNFGYAKGVRSTIRRDDWVRYSMIDGRPLFIFASIDKITAAEA
jgi:hypothetical protein